MKRLSLVVASGLLAVACSKDPPPATQTTAANTQAVTTPAVAADAPAAEVGKPAPDFTLNDLDGKPTTLSSFKGKTVVLEWFNPGCPFVNKSHTKGSLKDEPAKAIKTGVVWLAINSAASGKQGAAADANRDGAKKLGMNYPVLLDVNGDVGKKYGATNTPHIMVIDPSGNLLYRGAVDNASDGEGETPTGGKLDSYVEDAVIASQNGKTPAVTETKAYGCGVKYGSASH